MAAMGLSCVLCAQSWQHQCPVHALSTMPCSTEPKHAGAGAAVVAPINLVCGVWAAECGGWARSVNHVPKYDCLLMCSVNSALRPDQLEWFLIPCHIRMFPCDCPSGGAAGCPYQLRAVNSHRCRHARRPHAGHDCRDA